MSLSAPDRNNDEPTTLLRDSIVLRVEYVPPQSVAHANERTGQSTEAAICPQLRHILEDNEPGSKHARKTKYNQRKVFVLGVAAASSQG